MIANELREELTQLRTRVDELEMLVLALLEPQDSDEPEEVNVLESMHARFAGRVQGQRG